MIEGLEEDLRRKAEEFDEERVDLLDQLEVKKQEVSRLADELQKANTGYSNIGFNVDADEASTLRQEKDDLEQQLNEQHKKYIDLLEKNTELAQKARDEEFSRKKLEDEAEDLRQRLQFYTQGETGGNQLGDEPIDLSNINQSDFGSLLGVDQT